MWKHQRNALRTQPWGTGCLEEVQNSATTETGAIGHPYIGIGTGLNIGGTVAIQVSNADYISDLSGGFGYFNVSGELGAGASITVWFSLPGAPRFIYGGDVGPSIGPGPDFAGASSFTWVNRFESWQSAAATALAAPKVANPVKKLTFVR